MEILTDVKKASNILVRRPERKRALGRSRRRWDADIRKDLSEIGWDGVD